MAKKKLEEPVTTDTYKKIKELLEEREVSCPQRQIEIDQELLELSE